MIISNFKNLAGNSLRRKALEIAEAGYEAIEIEKVVKRRIKLSDGKLKIVHSQILENFGINKKATKAELEAEIDLNNFKRIFIVGIGKGSALACAALAKILGKKLNKGIVLDIKNLKSKILNLKTFVGTHPLPSKQNIRATKEIIKLAGNLNEKDLLITFICGGGSALACASEEELKNSTLATKELTKAGATIDELNTVRKHLSEFKGGGLAKMACPATVISLIVSDVCGNDLSNVASGPTVFDKTTKKDAEKILIKYGLNLADFYLYETPKDKKCFNKVKNVLFVCNQDAVMAMIEKAQKLGFRAKIHSLALEGEAKTAFLPMVKNIKFGEAIIAAGETTVTLKNQKLKIKNKNDKLKFKIDKGGRNQEAILGAITKIQNSVVISFASDGRDNTEAAGAIADILTIQKAKKLKLNPREFLERHNSFNFFKKTGDLIYAEQKCFNVADLMLVLKK